MPGRRRKPNPRLRRFEIVALAVALLGAPLALGLPGTFMGKLYALLALPVVAFGAAGAAVYLGRRRDGPAAEPLLPAARDLLVPQQPVDASRWNPDLLNRLEWRRFEELCAAYFEALGFRAELKGFGADRGVDLALYEQGAQAPGILVRCKGWNTYRVGIRSVRELLGAMGAGKVGEGAFATSGIFSEEARALARKHNIHLIDGADLLAKILDLPAEKAAALLALATRGDFLTPACPACGVKMAQRSSSKYAKQFWGCVNYPKCGQTFS